MVKLGGWKGPIDFVVVKMDDFDVILGIEFLLEHQVIPMPSAKCLVTIGVFSLVVEVDIRQPNGFKMILAMKLDKNHAQKEPPSVAILLGALRKLGETVPKDTLCVPKKYHGWGGNPEWWTAFDGLKQATIEERSLGDAGATKPSKDEVEQFNSQFGHSAQTDSLIKRIQFVINGNRHSILPLVIDDPYVGNNPQVHRVEKK
ncbi:Asp_protease_2 domain-containing protein [Cucumis melo var. makuwa]|uniref:Asp_protease_2 domain-containing protein n=1 Tax=Cucumis melo var. makuwa TaxID=1194695 RepID=A0A5A7TL94_CUCMM|nr:Asp_protease_2 domain-containing protein [Cucumis melo var. makuwa]TYK15474.1 Asp_protease_2 domain-containing protein [Cucumis melo var. makuwa]